MFYANRPPTMAALARGPRRPDADDDEFEIPLRLRPINSNMDRLLYGGRSNPAPWASSNYSFGQSFGQLQSFQPPAPAPAPAAVDTAAAAGVRRRPTAPGGGATPRAEEEAGWNIPALAAGVHEHVEDEDEDDGVDDEPDIPLKLRAGPTSLDQLISTTAATTISPPVADPQPAAAPSQPAPPPAFDSSSFARTSPEPSANPITSSSFAPQPPAPAAEASAPVPAPSDDYDSDADDRPRFNGPAKGRTPNRRLTIAELESLPDQELLMQALRALGYSTHARDDSDDDDEDADEATSNSNTRRRGAGSSHPPVEEPEVRLRRGRGNFGMQWGEDVRW
ncbi:hypothetical protein DFH27DRAFT_580187 [Peziza echinospora]|nr:hypothetical protein DFH27DRAFT_580187 [Peziza echinospora]